MSYINNEKYGRCGIVTCPSLAMCSSFCFFLVTPIPIAATFLPVFLFFIVVRRRGWERNWGCGFTDDSRRGKDGEREIRAWPAIDLAHRDCDVENGVRFSSLICMPLFG